MDGDLNGDGLSIDVNTIPMDGRVAASKMQTSNLIHDTMQRIAISHRCKPPSTSTVVLSRYVGPSVSILMLGVRSMSIQMYYSLSLTNMVDTMECSFEAGIRIRSMFEMDRFGWWP